MIRTLAIAALVVLAGLRPAASQGVVADLPVSPTSSERVLYLPASQPRAVVILLTGGDGVIRIGDAGGIDPGGNFLVRTRSYWAGQGIAALVLAPPGGGSLLGQRHTSAYAAALGVAAEYARVQAHAPVWLIGTSQGTTAATNGAAHLAGKVSGVVLTSSVTRASRSGETVFDAEPGVIRVPALVVSNTRDTCVASPAADGPTLLAALAASPRREFITFESGDLRGDPCEAMSPHGYMGIEPSVIQRIAAWISAAPGR